MTTAVEKEAPKTKKTEIETVIFERIDQRDSGFIQEGTERLPEPIQLRSPKFLSSIRSSHYLSKPEGKDKQRSAVYIRYINGVDVVEVDIQRQKGLESRVNPKRDLIIFKDGQLVVANEGRLIGLVNYMRKSSFCGTNPDRDPTVEVLWVEVFPEKTKSDVNEKAFLEGDAVAMIRKLVERDGDGYTYDEDKLSAYCDLMGATAESPAGKVNLLIALAKKDPANFIEKVKIFEQQYMSEIALAVELGVIQFDDTAVSYVKDGKLITTYNSKLNKGQRYEKLAGFFQTFEGDGAYKIFKVELDQAKERLTNK